MRLKPLITTLFLLLLSHGAWAIPEQLSIGIHDNLKPLEYTSRDGAPRGALVDFWSKWGELNHVRVNFVAGSQKQLEDRLQTGAIDLIANAQKHAPLPLSTPYYDYPYYLYTLKKFHLAKLAKLTIRLGIMKKDEPFLDPKILTRGNLFYFDSFQQMVNDLKQGEIDAFIANDIGLIFAVQNTDLLLLNYPDEPLHSHALQAAVRPGNEALLPQIEDGITRISPIEKQAIASKWAPAILGYKIPWALVAVSIVVILCCALVMAIWLVNVKLRRQIFNATRSLIREKDLMRKTKDEAVAQQKNLKILLDSVNSCIFSINADGLITHLNRHARQWLGEDTGELKVLAINDCPFLHKFEDQLLNALQAKEPVSIYRQKIVLGNGSNLLVNIRMLPIVAGESAQALVLIDDVTEISAKEELLVQSQKLEVINSLAGGVAHDFNNVLAVISGSASLLALKMAKQETLQIEKLKSYVSNISKAVEKGVATTKSLAALSGRVSVDFTSFSLTEAVADIVQICRTTMDRSVQLSYQPPSAEYTIHGNRGLLEQALLNILINAYHATTIMRSPHGRRGGRVTISITAAEPGQTGQLTGPGEAPGYVQVRISDDGVGFSKETLAHAFTPFFTTKEKTIGTGLGLTMVHNTISQHQGQIVIESEQNRGTDVCIYLPIPEEAELHQEPAQQSPETQRFTCSILLADDNPAIIETLGSGLESFGHRVITVQNGQELIEQYQQAAEEIDLIISDLEMPLTSGDEAFYKIREINPEAKFIMTSGFLEDERVQKALKAGAAGFIPKPCKLEILLQKIEFCLQA